MVRYKKFKNAEAKGTLSWQGSDGSVLWVMQEPNSKMWEVFCEHGMGIFRTHGKFKAKPDAVEHAELYMRRHK